MEKAKSRAPSDHAGWEWIGRDHSFQDDSVENVPRHRQELSNFSVIGTFTEIALLLECHE